MHVRKLTGVAHVRRKFVTSWMGSCEHKNTAYAWLYAVRCGRSSPIRGSFNAALSQRHHHTPEQFVAPAVGQENRAEGGLTMSV